MLKKKFKKYISVYDSDSSKWFDEADNDKSQEVSEEEEMARPALELVDMPLDVLLEVWNSHFFWILTH